MPFVFNLESGDVKFLKKSFSGYGMEPCITIHWVRWPATSFAGQTNQGELILIIPLPNAQPEPLGIPLTVTQKFSESVFEYRKVSVANEFF